MTWQLQPPFDADACYVTSADQSGLPKLASPAHVRPRLRRAVQRARLDYEQAMDAHDMPCPGEAAAKFDGFQRTARSVLAYAPPGVVAERRVFLHICRKVGLRCFEFAKYQQRGEHLLLTISGTSTIFRR
jgi:hypothetical protein